MKAESCLRQVHDSLRTRLRRFASGSTRAQSGRSPAPQVLSHLVLGRQHWAFQPVRRPLVPKTTANTIDAFIHGKLQNEGIAPSPEADARHLPAEFPSILPVSCRRLSEIQSFLNDRSSAGLGARQVDRLLASPHYGEHWARHWLDLARYADSDGYEKDSIRADAWRYRDWVIDALNRDMPFDQFTIEQIAGDLLPNATIDRVSPPASIATR